MEDIKNRIDIKLLQRVLSIQSNHLDDSAMTNFILSELSKMNVLVQQDGYGNIYVTKGKANDYPCLVAHTDTVHSKVSELILYRASDILFAFDPATKRQTGIGGDDKVGVYILLQALMDLPLLKAVFFRHEEIGCLGSRYSITNHKDWYENCNYVIQPDRRDFNDLITSIGNIPIASKEFVKSISKYAKQYNYKETMGITTDVFTLSLHRINVSCINMSCGYLSPHTSSEVVSISGVNKAYNFIYDILTEMPNIKFENEFKIEFVKTKPKTPAFLSDLMKEKRDKQLKLFDVEEIENLRYGSRVEFENFIKSGISTTGKPMYTYIGVNAIPLPVDITCSTCNEKSRDIFYFPYEGRMMCLKCRRYIDDDLVPVYIKHIRVEDSEVSFVYSLLLKSWLKQKEATWDEITQSWVSCDLPF